CLLISLLFQVWYPIANAQQGEGNEPDEPPEPVIFPPLPRASYLLNSGDGKYSIAISVLAPGYQSQIVYNDVPYTVVPKWTRSGRLLLFAGKVNQKEDIFVFDSIRGVVTNLTQNSAIDTDPAWSPSQKQIAFASDRGKDAGAT